MKWECLRCNKEFIDEELVQIHLLWLHHSRRELLKKAFDELTQIKKTLDEINELDKFEKLN